MLSLSAAPSPRRTGACSVEASQIFTLLTMGPGVPSLFGLWSGSAKALAARSALEQLKK